MRGNTTIALGIMLLLITPLQACGRKGPLYLQRVPAPVTVAPASAVAPQSAPSPATPSAAPAAQPSPNPTPTQPVQQP